MSLAVQPSPIEASVSPRWSAAEAQLLRAVTGDVQRSSPSLAYRIAMIALLVPMLLLPLVYIGLIVAAGWGVYYHAVNHLTWISHAPSKVLGASLYLGALSGGALVVAFMIKPFFAPRGKVGPNPYVLERSQEPLLFAFVERLSVTLGAPAPKRIEVDCIPNASASLDNGLRGLLSRNLTLTIGMSMVDAFTVRQFAGVLAHELGHFAQGAGMRSTYIAGRINRWFARVVYERDAWDEKLSYYSKEGTFLWTMVIAWCGAICVWLTRRILWLLMMASHAMSCMMLRRMEYDADGYQVRLAGSDTMASGLTRINEIAWAFDVRASQMHRARTKGRLVDDLPAFVTGTVQEMPAEGRDALHKSFKDERASWFDSHPTMQARIAHAEALNTPGLFQVEQPASVLFRNYKAVCQWTTLGFYHAHLDDAITSDDLITADNALQRTRKGFAARDAAGRYYQLAVTPLHPLVDIEMPTETAAPIATLREALRDCRQQILGAAEQGRQASAQLHESHDRLREIDMARELLKTFPQISHKEFSLPDTRDETIADELAKAAEQMDATRGPLEQVASAMVQRLNITLQLLCNVAMEDHLSEREDLRREAGVLTDALRTINDARETEMKLDRAFAALTILLHNAEGRDEEKPFTQRVQTVAGECFDLLLQTALALGEAPYPLEQGREARTIAEVCIDEMPPQDDPWQIGGACSTVLQELHSLEIEVLERLAMIGQQVEHALGLEPLPEPPMPADEAV